MPVATFIYINIIKIVSHRWQPRWVRGMEAEHRLRWPCVRQVAGLGVALHYLQDPLLEVAFVKTEDRFNFASRSSSGGRLL